LRRNLAGIFKDFGDKSYKSYWAAKKSGLGNLTPEQRAEFVKDFPQFQGASINEKEFRQTIYKMERKPGMTPQERARVKKEINFLKRRAGIK
jgi:hypothetical protein